MKIEDFKALADNKKLELLFDAEKVSEYHDDIATYELFKVGDFFIEVSRSVTHRFRKILNTYSLENIPPAYSPNVYSKSA